jgi:uncharacterized membrane protein YqhA
MLRQILASSRYVILVAVIATLTISIALIIYETVIVADALIRLLREGSISPAVGKTLAVSVIEVIDVFLIAIVAYITGLGLYSLFVDDTIPLPRWLKNNDFDDLKNHLVSVIIAVLAVLFLREAVSRAADVDLLSLAIALAVIIAALTFFLVVKRR